nr:MAG TPA: hypothetical protein [Caudoviricetes sp.]
MCGTDQIPRIVVLVDNFEIHEVLSFFKKNRGIEAAGKPLFSIRRPWSDSQSPAVRH